MKAIIACALSLTLAACGSRAPLQFAPGQEQPAKPAAAADPLTPAELLTPPPVARPERKDEPLRRSEPREDDRFDLPPPQ